MKKSLKRWPYRYFFLPLFLFSVVVCSHATDRRPAVIATASLDLQAYLGTWYEIASLPNPFQKGCTATQATYMMQKPGGDIQVTNACRRGGLDKELTSKTGTAWRPNSSFPAQLKVQFFWPFSGDYWVLAKASDYSWAVVGQPSRKYLWMLSRTPKVGPQVLSAMRQVAIDQGYDLSDLHLTPQP